MLVTIVTVLLAGWLSVFRTISFPWYGEAKLSGSENIEVLHRLFRSCNKKAMLFLKQLTVKILRHLKCQKLKTDIKNERKDDDIECSKETTCQFGSSLILRDNGIQYLITYYLSTLPATCITEQRFSKIKKLLLMHLLEFLMGNVVDLITKRYLQVHWQL